MHYVNMFISFDFRVDFCIRFVLLCDWNREKKRIDYGFNRFQESQVKSISFFIESVQISVPNQEEGTNEQNCQTDNLISFDWYGIYITLSTRQRKHPLGRSKIAQKKLSNLIQFQSYQRKKFNTFTFHIFPLSIKYLLLNFFLSHSFFFSFSHFFSISESTR